MPTDSKGINVLVTGGAGFIGSHLCEALLGCGYHVTALDDLSRGHSANLTTVIDHERFKLINEKVTNENLVLELAQNCQTIYHLAASIGNPMNPRVDLNVNVVGTFNVLEAARLSDSCPTVVYPSTNKVYADNVNNIRFTEESSRYTIEDPTFIHGIPEGFRVDQGHQNLYALSKVAAETFVRNYSHLYGVRTGIFRQSTIYGPRDNGGWISLVGRSAIEKGTVKVYGDGKQLRDILYVTDLVRAYITFASSDNIPSGMWNVGGGSEFTLSIIELVGLLAKLTGKQIKIVYEQAPQGDQKVFCSDIRLLQKDFGWNPSVTPKRGIEQTVEWIRRQS